MTDAELDRHADDVIADVMELIAGVEEVDGGRDWARAHEQLDAVAERYGWEQVGAVLLAKAVGFLAMYARATGRSRRDIIDAYTLIALEDAEPEE